MLVRSDGRPTYNFVSPLEDALDGITHVMRGQDHVSNTPKQLRILEAIGAELPAYAHVAAPERPRRPQALEAPRRDHRRGLPRAGLPPGGARQLPRAARLELRRPHRGHEPRRSSSSASRSSASARAPRSSTTRSSSWLNGIYLRALPPDEYADALVALPARAGLRVGRGADPQGGAARAGEDRDARRVPGVRRASSSRGSSPRATLGRRDAARGGRGAGARSSRSRPERSRRRYAGWPSGSGSSRATRFSPFAWRSPARRSRPASSRASSSSAARSPSRGSQAAAAAARAGRAPAETRARRAAGRSVSAEGSRPRYLPFLSDKTVEAGKRDTAMSVNCRPPRCPRS